MSEKGARPKDVVILDVETNVQTAEGRVFLNQLNAVSRVLHLKDTTVQFKGEVVAQTGYVGDFKSLTLYKCPNGYCLFGDKAFGKNNVAWVGKTVEEVLAQVPDEAARRQVAELVTTREAA